MKVIPKLMINASPSPNASPEQFRNDYTRIPLWCAGYRTAYKAQRENNRKRYEWVGDKRKECYYVAKAPCRVFSPDYAYL